MYSYMMDQDATGQREQQRGERNTNSRVEGQDRGRIGQAMGAGMNEGQERMLSGGGTVNLEGGGMGVGS